MAGTDVAKDVPAENEPTPSAKTPSTFLTFLRIWLPFPLMLAGILFFQFSRGGLERKTKTPEADAAPFQGAGQDLPALMQSLTLERAAVEQQRKDLEFAQRRILLEQSEIGARQKEVEKLLERVEAKFGKMEGDRVQMLAQLARVYETMKPGTAAEILSGMDVATATEVLRRMKEKKAAEILSKLPADSAKKISEAMLQPGKSE
jgi:flagellar motility protein MotE (MotC chaperone)